MLERYLKRATAIACGLFALSCATAVQHGPEQRETLRLTNKTGVWSLLVDVRMLPQGVIATPVANRRFTLTYTDGDDAGVLLVSGGPVRTRRVSYGELNSIVRAIEESDFLGRHEPRRDIHGLFWEVSVRINDSVGYVVIRNDQPPLAALLERLAATR